MEKEERKKGQKNRIKREERSKGKKGRTEGRNDGVKENEYGV